MKNFIFITCLCVTSLAYAGNSNCSPDAQVRPSKLNATAYEPEVRTIEFGGGFLLDNLMKDADSRIKSSGSQFQFNKHLHGQALKKELEVIHK